MNVQSAKWREGRKWAGMLAMGLAIVLAADRAGADGNWLTLANRATAAVGNMILLPDGTVLCANNPDGDSSNFGFVWYRLTPDANGHYVNGTWSNIAPMHDTRRFYSSQIVRDGRLFVAGGEYGSGFASAEIYNPQTDTWTPVNPPAALLNPANLSPEILSSLNGGLQGFYDSESMMLPDGNVLIFPVGGNASGQMLIYNPSANLWTNGPTVPGPNSLDEATWLKLPDGSILTVIPNSTIALRYIPSMTNWVVDAPVPIALYSTTGTETGPAFMLPNGKGFFLGGSGHTVLYTPSGGLGNGSWTPGPDMSNNLVSADVPAAMMPNGKILCALTAAPTGPNTNVSYSSFVSFWEYDYTNGPVGSFTQVNGPTGLTDGVQPYQTSMLALPDGSVLYCDSVENNGLSSGANLYVYVPLDGTQQTLGKQPVINNIASNPDGTYTLTGTGLNGLSAGAAYGDDEQMDSDFPLVEFIDTDNGHIDYGRTFNWSSTGVQTGGAIETTEFALPAGLLPKTYEFKVIASGVTSAPVAFSFVTPNPLEMCPGESNALSVIPSPLPATYQWLFNGNSIAGQTNSTLILPYATTNQSGLYSLKLTTGGSSTISQSVPVSVGVWEYAPPAPTNTAILCQSNTLSATAQGKGELTGQWYHNGLPVDLSAGSGITTNITSQFGGGTTLSLHFSDVKYQDDGTYTLVISDDCGPVTNSPFTMRVKPNPPWVLVATNGPSSRYQAAMANDPFRGVTVLFGGQINAQSGSPLLNDTWEFDGTNWTQRFPATSPPARSQAQMVYDWSLRKAVLFGGQIYTNLQMHITLDTWTWDGTNWQQIITPNTPDWTQPSPFGACYDIGNNEMLIFGGISSTGRVSELWAFKGTNWVQKTPAPPTPVATTTTVMAYDGYRNVSVLLGANSQAYPLPYTAAAVWEWDGTAWHEKPQSGQVMAGASAIDGAVYDSFRHETVLYGEVFGIIDGILSSSYTPYPYGYRFVWRWDGANWQADPPTPTLGVTLQLYPSMVFDVDRNEIVLFGGQDNSSLPATNYTYEILYQDDPVVLKQPTIQASLVGQKVQLSVLAAGAPPIAYQWSKDGVNLADGGRISGSGTNILTINPASVADSGQYQVTMNNLCGLGVSQPIVLNVAAGSDMLAIALSGGGGSGSGQKIIITWGDSAATLQSSTNVAGPWTTITGATSPYTYTINPVFPAQFFRLLVP